MMGCPEKKTEITIDTGLINSLDNLPPFAWVKFFLKSIIVLNLLDGILTLVWVKYGLAEEANLFLRGLVHNQPVTFILLKISVVTLCCLFLWKNRSHPFAEKGLFIVFSIYSAIFVYHLHFLNILLFHTPAH